ncbi:MAG: FeoC-like transcriptional regulator [Anaerolineales bacterium]|jgi:hypothetical protein
MSETGLLLKILEQFEHSGGVLAAQQVADAVEKDIHVTCGMLDTLVRMGRLEVNEGPACDICPLRAVCTPPDTSTLCYRLPE